MTKMELLINSLPEEDVQKVQRWIEKSPDEIKKDPDEAVQQIIHNIMWDYKRQAEAAPPGQGREIEKKKAELYDKWNELGLLD
jgi:hypothetical protein